MIRRQVRKTLHAQGTGRHTLAEITALGTRTIDSIADYLGQKPFFMGIEPAASMRPSSLSSPASCAPSLKRRCARPPSGTTTQGLCWAHDRPLLPGAGEMAGRKPAA